MWVLVIVLNIAGQQMIAYRALPDKAICGQQMRLINNTPNNVNLFASCVEQK